MKILVTGPESTGKSTLSYQLAVCLGGQFVPEAARSYLEGLNRPYTFPDLATIWRIQSADEAAAVRTGAAFVVCDTGPEVIRVWSEEKYGRCAPEVLQAVRERPYDVRLLCYPDLPWTYDPQREHPDPADRHRLFQRYRELLPSATVIAGNRRLADALAAVDAYLARPAFAT